MVDAVSDFGGKIVVHTDRPTAIALGEVAVFVMNFIGRSILQAFVVAGITENYRPENEQEYEIKSIVGHVVQCSKFVF